MLIHHLRFSFSTYLKVLSFYVNNQVIKGISESLLYASGKQFSSIWKSLNSKLVGITFWENMFFQVTKLVIVRKVDWFNFNSI